MNQRTWAITQWSCAHTGNTVIDISIKLCPSIKLPYLLSNHIMFMRNTAQWNMPQLYTTDPPHANNLVWIPSSHSKNYTIHQCLLWSGAHHIITAHCALAYKGEIPGKIPGKLLAALVGWTSPALLNSFHMILVLPAATLIFIMQSNTLPHPWWPL